MSHNIEYNRLRGSYSCITVKEPAWHRLGKVVETAMTIDEAIAGANLDFNVCKTPCFANTEFIEDGEPVSRMVNVPNKYATYRTDNGDVLGSVGSAYQVVQNSEAFSFFDTFLKKTDAVFQTAGVLGNGEIVFISAKLPNYIKVAHNDVVEQYLLLSTSHDGSKNVEMMFTPIRVVCNNTLNAALTSNASRIRVRHTGSAHDKLKEAGKLMGITNERMEFMRGAYPELVKIKMTDTQVKDYINFTFLNKKELGALALAGTTNFYDIEEISTRKSNIIDDVYKSYFIGPGQQLDSAKGTAWGAYNAVTGYFQNVKSSKNAANDMKSNMYGANYDVMQSAFVRAMQLG